LLKDFAAALETDAEVKQLKAEVEKFATSFPMPGFDPAKIDRSLLEHH